MTHTLHRRGSAESLANDFPMLSIRAVGFNDEGSDEKLQQFMRIALHHKPVNIGAVSLGNMFDHEVEEIVSKAHGVMHAVFDNPQAVVACLRELKEADIGMSVVVSGILDEVNKCCKEAGLKRHTVEFSLGVWGETDRLPPEEVLEVTTMCGHGLVSASLVTQMVEEIRSGARTADDAAKEVARQCTCGVFNPVRAATLLKAMATA